MTTLKRDVIMKVGCLMLLIAVFISGCLATGNTTYKGPSDPITAFETYRVYDHDMDTVWDACLNYAADSFFSLEHIVKDSGIITLSFSAPDPSDYIDCGVLNSSVNSMNGKRTYQIPLAAPENRYQIVSDGVLYDTQRTAGLNGQINIYFDDISPAETKVKVRIR